MLSGCKIFGYEERARYKMTLVIDTPNGERSGSAVREVVFHVPNKLPSLVQARASWILRGEAVAVDVIPGQTLFALLIGGRRDPEYATRILAKIYGSASPEWPSDTPRTVTIWPTAPLALIRDTDDPLPMLARFRDIAAPKSIERVDPANLADTFGPGVALRSITISLVDEPITNTMGSRLRWLQSMPTGMMSGDSSELVQSPDFADHISRTYLTQELGI